MIINFFYKNWINKIMTNDLFIHIIEDLYLLLFNHSCLISCKIIFLKRKFYYDYNL